MRAVRFHRYGDIDVLQIEDVPLRPLGPRDVLVRVRAAGINPGEAKIRTGALHDTFPATFPSGQGSDLAGTITETGSEVTLRQPGDDVLGWSWERSSHAEYVVVPQDQLVAKPADLPWPPAGALYVAGATAWASVNAVDPHPGDHVLLAGATGGVGTIALQLLRLRGADVTAIASPRHQAWIEQHGATFAAYGPRLADDLEHSTGRPHPDAVVDLHGGYVDLALSLGVAPDRINTINYDAAAAHGTRSDASAEGTQPDALAELARLAANHTIEIPIAATYPLDQVRAAFTHLEQRHPLGKIVLLP